MHGLYEGALRHLVLRVKFSEDHAAARLLGGLLATACADLPRPDGVVPVPLHPERLRRRGCNQCLELARLPAAALGAPLRPGWLTRVTPTRWPAPWTACCGPVPWRWTAPWRRAPRPIPADRDSRRFPRVSSARAGRSAGPFPPCRRPPPPALSAFHGDTTRCFV